MTTIRESTATGGLARAAWLVLAALAAGMAGCASAPVAEQPKLVWPPPPLEPRIRFVRSIYSEQDLREDRTFRESMAVFLGGEAIPAGRIAEPAGLAVSDDGQRLYVSDPLQKTVFVFDFANKKLREVRSGPFPSGIALDAEENLYVVDQMEKSVRVFDRAGKELRTIGDASLVRPNGIAVDSANDRVYVVDTGSREAQQQNVKVFNRAGQRIGAIGGEPGGDFGQFMYPTMATVDRNGYLYVSDTLNGRVQKFDAQGNFVLSFGRIGSNWGEFDKPKGVAVDSFGNLYVVDSGWSNVQIFNPKSQILLFFGGRGPVPGMMKNPMTIAIDRNNRIYVGDYLNHRINVYELVNTRAEDSFVTPPPNPVGTQMQKKKG